MKLKSDLTYIALKAEDAARKALKKTGEEIANLASQLAPKDTGRLANSYRSEPVSSTEVHVGSDVPYSVWVEFGTSDGQPAQPHLTPAFHTNEEVFRKNLLDEMKELNGRD